MIIAAQQASGPASAPTLPDLGSNNPIQENAVNALSNTPTPVVPATATRHQAFKSLGGGAAMGLTEAVIGSTTSCAPTEAPAPIHDPLLDLINDLKAEEAMVFAIENDDESDAAAEARLSPIIDRIIHETQPATTAAGAYAALERVHYGMSEAGPGVYDKALLKAAMAYLEGRAA